MGGWIGPRGDLDDVEKRKLLTLPGLELRPLGRQVRSQSLYRLSYRGSLWVQDAIRSFTEKFKTVFEIKHADWRTWHVHYTSIEVFCKLYVRIMRDRLHERPLFHPQLLPGINVTQTGSHRVSFASQNKLFRYIYNENTSIVTKLKTAR
jgi:hypothetical protein